VLIQNKDETYFPYLNISEAYWAKGMYDKAKEVLEYYIDNFSDNDQIRWGLAYTHLIQRDYEFALSEADKAFYLNPVYYHILLRGNIYMCMGDLNKAEEEYQKLLELEEKIAHLNGRNCLGALSLLQGRFEKAKDQMKQGLELAKNLGVKSWERSYHFKLGYINIKQRNAEKAMDEFHKAWNNAVEVENLDAQRWALYWKGRTYLGQKSMDEALRVADELRELIEQGMKRKSIRLYHHLMGMIELEREKFSKAIEHFKRAISLLPHQRDSNDDHALFIQSLALANYKSEHLERATKEYERIIALTIGRLYYGDIYAKSFYMLGKIYEQKGNNTKALEHYEKFLDLWKDADPGIAEAGDAKKRVAGLKRQ